MSIVKPITVGVDHTHTATRVSSKPDCNDTVYNTGDACYVLGT